MTAPVPIELRGIWRRVALAVDSNPVDDDSRCIWAQGQRHFVDVRVPPNHPGEGSVFAGTTTCGPGTVTWHHAFDIRLDLPEPTTTFADTAAVDIHDDHLTERGTIDIGGTLIPYEEVWQRVTARGEPTSTSIVEGNAGCVAVAVTSDVWMVVACAEGSHRGGGGWMLRRTAGEPGSPWSTELGTSSAPIAMPASGHDPDRPWIRTPA